VKRILTAAALAALLAGCGGGGSGHSLLPPAGSGSSGAGSGSNVPVNGNARGTATVIAKANLATSAIPAMYDRKIAAAKRTSAKRIAQSGTPITSVEIDGTLYQGSASAIPVTNTQTVPVTNGSIAVSETFSNVVPANNDWVIFAFYAVAADGSKVAIGSLGTLVNVGANTTTTNLGTTSTQELQVAGALLSIGAISTYDIEQNPALATALATKIATLNPAVDSQTGVYDVTTLQTITDSLASAFERDLTISAANATEFSVVYDSTQADENDLAYNAVTFATAYGLNVTQNRASQPLPAPGGTSTYNDATVLANPMLQSGASVPLHGPSSGYADAQPAEVEAYLFEAQSGSVTIKNVYGGHLIIGAHNAVVDQNEEYDDSKARKTGLAAKRTASATRTVSDVTTEPYGANAAIAGEAPGASAQSLTLASSQNTISVIDAQADAFGQTPGNYGQNPGYNTYGFGVLAGANAAGVIPTYSVDCVSSCDTYGLISGQFSNSAASIGAPGANGAATLTYDAWNAFNIPPAQVELCGFTSCAALSSTSPVNITSAFTDYGENDAVFGWTAGAGVVSISPANEYPYVITYTIPANNTAAVSFTVTGTVPATFGTPPVGLLGTVYVPARTQLYLETTGYNDTASMTLTDTNGNTYSSSGSGDGYQSFASISTPLALAAFSITFTVPAASVQNPSSSPTTGNISLYRLYVQGSYVTSNSNDY